MICFFRNAIKFDIRSKCGIGIDIDLQSDIKLSKIVFMGYRDFYCIGDKSWMKIGNK